MMAVRIIGTNMQELREEGMRWCLGVYERERERGEGGRWERMDDLQDLDRLIG